MTTANMKLVALSVTFPGELEVSSAKLEEGEHIVKRVVELDKLYDELQGPSPYLPLSFFGITQRDSCSCNDMHPESQIVIGASPTWASHCPVQNTSVRYDSSLFTFVFSLSFLAVIGYIAHCVARFS